MRKTKLIILPTKCLNRMGFLLLFLSCPVIGDWGRIRPDSEMSQWSILIEKEGSSGLVRNSQGNELMRGEWEECKKINAAARNDSLTTTGNFVDVEESISGTHKRNEDVTERRSHRRDVRERRTVSLDRRNAFRHIENSRRNDRTIQQEHRRINYVRQLSLERRVRNDNEVRRESPQRRLKRETASRRVENIAGSRRMQERRVSRRVDNEDAMNRRASPEMRNLSRVRVENVESRNAAERRERHEERRIVKGDRRSSEREAIQSRRMGDEEGSRLSGRRVETRRDTSEERAPDARRTMRRSTVRRAQSEPGVRRNAATADTRRRERSVERREALLKENRKMTVDLSRRQEIRVGKHQEREDNARERKARIDRHNGLESLALKQKEIETGEEPGWKFLHGIKNWFHQKVDLGNRMGNNDFATTCFVGVTAYLLATRPIKTV